MLRFVDKIKSLSVLFDRLQYPSADGTLSRSCMSSRLIRNSALPAVEATVSSILERKKG